MKLSIITINYNNEAGLKKTVQSIVDQTYKDYEYIIIDGGSTDGSVGIIKENESKVDYWISEKDKGIFNAMNKGLAVAKGDYCLFMNSGDYLSSPTILKEVEPYFAGGEDIIYGDVYFEFPDGTIVAPPHEADINLFKLTYTNLPHQGSFIKRNLLVELGGYREDYKIASDWILILQAVVERNASFKKIAPIISYFDKSGISSVTSSGHENIDALHRFYPYLVSQFESNRELRYYQLSKAHQMLKKALKFVKGK